MRGESTIDYPQAISQAAMQNNVDPSLALEVAIAESNLNPDAVSPAGAIGIMQLMPATAAQYGVDPTDPIDNIQGGTAYLGDLLAQFNGNQVAALAAYNWGPGNVNRAMRQWGPNWLAHAPGETQAYVGKILGNVSSQYQATGPIPAPSAASPMPLPNITLPMATIFPSSTGAGPGAWGSALASPQTNTLITIAIVGGIVLFVYALS